MVTDPKTFSKFPVFQINSAMYNPSECENLQEQFIKPQSLPAVPMPGAEPVTVSLPAQCNTTRGRTLLGCPPMPAFGPSLTHELVEARPGNHITSCGEAQPPSPLSTSSPSCPSLTPYITFWGGSPATVPLNYLLTILSISP
jgi:hypothetical protein